MGTAIGKDVPAFVTVFGNPAEARSMNFEGMRRRGFSAEQLPPCAVLQVVIGRGLPLSGDGRVGRVVRRFPEVAIFRDSIQASSRAALPVNSYEQSLMRVRAGRWWRRPSIFSASGLMQALKSPTRMPNSSASVAR